MKYSVQIENEFGLDGTKKQYDIFKNCHTTTKQACQIHTHTYYETVLVLEGELTYWLPEQEPLTLHAGDVIFIPPHVIHQTYQKKEQCMRSAVVKFSPMFLYPMETTQSDVDCLLMSPIFKHDYFLFRDGSNVAERLGEIIRAIVDEHEKKTIGFELSLRGLLITLYTTLLRNCDSILPMHPQSLDGEPATSSARELYQILIYLKENYQYNISMQEVAEVFGMSYYHFSRFFKKLTNKKFNEYLLELRLNYAQKKLLQENKSISEVALECGFEYVSYFIQKFKAKNGMTPREFQRKYRLAVIGQTGRAGYMSRAMHHPNEDAIDEAMVFDGANVTTDETSGQE
ncbi:MAG: helix-turn-helix domain-containing protein [Ruminococcaceae bacterium]|nr:helix-turn-helix domain-containing protein [Oscillospiraceae bacterium]